MTALTVQTDERDLVEHYFDQPWGDGLPIVRRHPTAWPPCWMCWVDTPTNSWRAFHRGGAA